MPTTLMIIFIGKVSKLRHDMQVTNADTTHPSISDQIVKGKNYKASVEEVKNNCLSTMTSHRGLTTWMENY